MSPTRSCSEGICMLAGAAALLVLFATSAHSQVLRKSDWIQVCDQPNQCFLGAQVRHSSGQLINIEYSVTKGTFTISAWKRPIKRAQVWAPGGPSIVTDRCSGTKCALETQTSAELLRRLRNGATTGALLSVQVTCEDGAILGPLELSLGDFEAGYNFIVEETKKRGY